jgi:NADH dehydrogenase/NADH:ubiquinone oxidoreductase subunit G
LLQQQNFYSVQNNIVEKKLIIDQNCFTNNNLKMSNKMLLNYLYIPTNTFYQNTETFVNTEGFIKKTNQIISKNKTKNNWQILRKFLKYFKNNLVFFNTKNNEILFFNSNKFYNFKNFINFQYCPIKKITNLSCYINIKNKVFLLNKVNFKQKSMKFKFIKLKY